MASRSGRARIAGETVEIMQRGNYVLTSGSTVSIADELRAARRDTLLYTPEALELLLAQPPVRGAQATKISVENGTTFAAARRLAAEDPADDVLCLNFASAKNPGGGFLGGSQAQEEALSRQSGLYACINPMRAFYDANRVCRTCLYTEHLIYSPRVPVFRDDEDELLPQPFLTSIITSPAVNAGAVRKNEPERIAEIEPTMRSRIERIFAVAQRHQHRTLVLGAWGCGVFRNDPAVIARLFHEALTSARFAGIFRRIVFAVLDWSDEKTFIGPFEREFGG